MAREFSKAFYNSVEWQRVRSYCLLRDHHECQLCGAPAEEVHHIVHLKPSNIYDAKIALNPDNLISLCKDCHFAQHTQDKAAGNKARTQKDCCGEGLMFDEDGMLIEINPPVTPEI